MSRADPPQVDWAVLLGGGQGRRAGGPKALKLRNGRPWWRLQAEAIAADGLRPLAVLHPDAWQGCEPPLPGEATPSDPEDPPFLSLKRGLELIPPHCAVWVLPVDCPWPGGAVLARLQPLLASGAWLAVVPLARDGEGRQRGGHPLGLSAAAAEQLRALPWHDCRDLRLDQWLRERGDRVARVDVGDAAVLANHNRNGIDQ